MKLYNLRKDLENHPFIDEVLDMADIFNGTVHVLLKVNDKYIADILSEENELENYISFLRFDTIPSVKITYEIVEK